MSVSHMNRKQKRAAGAINTKPTPLARIKNIEDMFDTLVRVANQGSTRQLLFGAALDVLINKGLITKEEISARADEIYEKINKPKAEEVAGIGTSDTGEESV